MADAKHVNWLLKITEEQYVIWLDEEKKEDVSLNRLQYFKRMLKEVKRDGLTDPDDTEMYINCLEHEVTRLQKLMFKPE